MIFICQMCHRMDLNADPAGRGWGPEEYHCADCCDRLRAELEPDLDALERELSEHGRT